MDKMIKEDLLKSMDLIHSICIENDIKYQLAYGSAIGALREKGIIDWDDDIDIVMTRSNYRKWKIITKDFDVKGFTLVRPKSNNKITSEKLYCDNPIIVYAKDNNNYKNFTGTFVDIVVADKIPNSKLLRSLHWSALYCVQVVLFSKSKNKVSDQWKKRGLVNWISKFVYLITFFVPLTFINVFKLLIIKLPSRNSNNYAISSIPAIYKLTIFENKYMEECILTEFEEREYYISKYAHEMLSIRYGNYMIPINEGNVHIKKTT